MLHTDYVFAVPPDPQPAPPWSPPAYGQLSHPVSSGHAHLIGFGGSSLGGSGSRNGADLRDAYWEVDTAFTAPSPASRPDAVFSRPTAFTSPPSAPAAGLATEESFLEKFHLLASSRI